MCAGHAIPLIVSQFPKPANGDRLCRLNTKFHLLNLGTLNPMCGLHLRSAAPQAAAGFENLSKKPGDYCDKHHSTRELPHSDG
jgi:hypothetical protein